MRLRQGCARVIDDPGAYKPLNLNECARVRQDRQGFSTYCGRARKVQGFILFLYIKIGALTLAILAQAVFMRRCLDSTLAQPWRNPGAKRG
jgi:hypothetical protein